MAEIPKHKNFSEAESVMLLKLALVAGETVRKVAADRLKWQRGDEDEGTTDSPSKGANFAKLVELLRDQNEKELQARRYKWRKERLDCQASESRFMQLLELLAKRG
ncbi:uncharacterized protein PITG_07593 [Phytophthora infestans T30-4]|uniref:Uncharacterized protein n=1 Tax=Phytophthora infestans (strain T30-4) TaxID=403677 RepID=D0N8Q7_PHYIT|nr:uncharacterized protein PITG_07593 [Phytophthora infestans T30-4]EEY53942.1 conserved hypothetical protein [Phytophthora infestans T30-4]|eukprot:XP_002904573.1 conserved hypothetical protein [Phytophthora infestans T30-4]